MKNGSQKYELDSKKQKQWKMSIAVDFRSNLYVQTISIDLEIS
jgi:hypothetical protein